MSRFGSGLAVGALGYLVSEYNGGLGVVGAVGGFLLGFAFGGGSNKEQSGPSSDSSATSHSRTKPYKKYGCTRCGSQSWWYWSDNDSDRFCPNCKR